MGSQQKGVPPFIGTDDSGNQQYPAEILFCPISFISPISPISCASLVIMTTPLIRCRGCGKEYTPRGLSQHVSKSRDIRCQPTPITSRVSAASSSIHHSAMPPSLNPICTLPISRNHMAGDQNDLVNGIQVSDGAFVVIHLYLRIACLIFAHGYR
jgi:hypothetical protein